MKTIHQLNQTEHPSCQVLVVGAGPSGLVLAAQLLARGVTTRVIDKGDGVVLQSRAGGIHSRTLEVLDSMGLAERFVEHGQVVRHFRMYTEGRPLVNLDLSRNGSRFGFMLDLPQNLTETFLRERIRELGGEVEQGLELLSLQEGPGGVAATVQDRLGDTRTITADYVAGCDGAHSRVRHELGLTFEGHAYPQDWLLADVLLDWDRREDEVHAFFRADGAPMICFPMPGHVWRLVMPTTRERPQQPPTLEEIQEFVNQRAPRAMVVSSPTWLANFRCHRRSTNVYRRGRVMLVGDAVHIHTPAGGQGMNTGIMDAHNLAWKLALVASGWASEALLDTYGEERAPVAAEVLSLTHRLVQFGSTTNPIGRSARDTIIPVVSRLPALQRRAVRRMSHQGVAYRSSSLTRPGGPRGRLRPGDSAPDIEVTGRNGKTGLHSALRGGRHVMLVSGADAAGVLDRPEMQPYRDQLEVVTGNFGPASRLGHDRPGSLFLVRPDGYIAARGRLDRMPSVVGYLRQLFGPDRTSSRRASLVAVVIQSLND